MLPVKRRPRRTFHPWLLKHYPLFPPFDRRSIPKPLASHSRGLVAQRVADGQATPAEEVAKHMDDLVLMTLMG